MWWENEFVSVAGDALALAGRRADEIAAENGTPLYVYGKKRILARYDALARTFESRTPHEVRICYAMKANPHPGILRLLAGRGGWIDAVSPGEVTSALGAGFPPERILFTGTSVSRKDMEILFGVGGLTLNIDAPEQLEVMGEVKREAFRNETIRVSVRWNPGLGRGFNPRVITAGKRSSDGTPIKFGVEAGKVLPTFDRARRLGFTPVGLHQHLGSGWVAEDFDTVREAVGRMIRMARRLERSGFGLEFLDFGGGFGPRYSRGQSLFPIEKYAEVVCRLLAGTGPRVRAIALEPGKDLVGDAGVVLLRVEYVKESRGLRFACVDGGTFNIVPRPAIYPQAHHEIVNASRVSSGTKRRWTIAGNLCETGDVFGRERLIPSPKRGDILAVLCTGAYCRSMASNFNLREIPGEILI
jgi:diaminopimelate decarboxylase